MDDHGRGHRQHRRPAGHHEGHKPAAKPKGDKAKRRAHHQGEPASPAGKRPGLKWLPYAAGASAAALVIMVAVFLRSPSPGPTPRPPPDVTPIRVTSGEPAPRDTRPDVKAPTPPREGGVASPPSRRPVREAGEGKAEASRRSAHDAFREVRRYETDRPKDFQGAIVRYEAVAREFPGTPEAGLAQMSVARLKSVAGLGPKPASPADRGRPVRTPARIPPDALDLDGHAYRVYRQAATWSEAKAHCERLGGHLVTIASEEENDFIIALAKEAGASVWIGMSDQLEKGKWGWLTGEEVTFTAWAAGMPNTLQGVEQHVCLWEGAEFAWDDHSGLGATGKQHMYVCEWETSPPRRGPPATAVREKAAAEADAGAGDVRERLAPLLAEFDSLVERHNFARAKKLAERRAAKLKRRKGKVNRALAAALRSAARTAGFLQSRRETIRHAAGALMKQHNGQEVTIETEKGSRKGKLVEVTEVGFTLVIQMKSGRQVIGETRMPVSWADLTVRQLDRLARAWKPGGPEGAFARAILAIERGEAKVAERELEAGGGGPFAEHLGRKVDALRMKEAEGSALASWETIRRWAERPEMTLEQAKSLFKLAAGFEEKYGQSRLAASKRGELARAKLRARRILIAAGQVPGSVEFADHRYKVYRYVTRWGEAKRFCEGLGGHLVTITSPEENRFVTGIAREVGVVAWIGLTSGAQGDEWRWVTGEKSDFRAWGQGTPSRTKRYAFLHSQQDYSWAGGFHYGIAVIICEWEPPRPVQAPAPSASEAMFVLPPGRKKVVLYEEDFEKGTGGWDGRAVKDEKGGGNVLRLEGPSSSRSFSLRTSRGIDGGIAATLKTRISLRYRTGGALSRLLVMLWLTGPSGERANYYLSPPVSAGWASVDFPAEWLRRNNRQTLELTKGFTISFLSVGVGRANEEGECFIDEFEVYDVVAGDAKSETPAKITRE